MPGLLHDECSAVHPMAVGSPFLRSLDLDRHGLEWCWPEVDLAHPLDDGSAGVMLRSIDGDGRRARRRRARVAAPVRRARPSASTSSTRTSCARSCTCRGTRSGWPASASPRRCRRRCWRGAFEAAAGARAVRRRRRARAQPAEPADELGGRHGADHRLPRLRLAGRARRLALDHRRARRGAARARRDDRDRACAVASLSELADGRRGRLRPGARARSPRSPATGCRGGSRAPTAATATARAPSRSTSRSRAGCRGRSEQCRKAGTVHATGSFEEIVAAEREVNRGRMPRAAVRARLPAVPRRSLALGRRRASGLGLRARAERLRR